MAAGLWNMYTCTDRDNEYEDSFNSRVKINNKDKSSKHLEESKYLIEQYRGMHTKVIDSLTKNLKEHFDKRIIDRYHNATMVESDYNIIKIFHNKRSEYTDAIIEAANEALSKSNGIMHTIQLPDKIGYMAKHKINLAILNRIVDTKILKKALDIIYDDDEMVKQLKSNVIRELYINESSIKKENIDRIELLLL